MNCNCKDLYCNIGKDYYPIPTDQGAHSLTAYAPLTRLKVKASRPSIRVKKQAKFTLFAVIAPKSYTKISLRYALIPWRDISMVLLINLSRIFPFSLSLCSFYFLRSMSV